MGVPGKRAQWAQLGTRQSKSGLRFFAVASYLCLFDRERCYMKTLETEEKRGKKEQVADSCFWTTIWYESVTQNHISKKKLLGFYLNDVESTIHPACDVSWNSHPGLDHSPLSPWGLASTGASSGFLEKHTRAGQMYMILSLASFELGSCLNLSFSS